MPDLIRSAAAFGIFQAMVGALRETGLAQSLRGPGPWTLLVVSDDEFLPPADEALETYLRRHVLIRDYDSWQLGQVRSVPTWGGETLTVQATGRIRIGGVEVLQADMKADNGILHVLARAVPAPLKGGNEKTPLGP